MRRVITLFFLIIITFLIQTTLFSFHDTTGIAPNILLIMTMSFGILRGRREGLLIGFFSGLLFDLFYNELLGPYALIFMLIGYVNGFFHKTFLMEDVLLPVLIVSVDQFVLDFFIYLASFLLRYRTEFTYYFKHIILPQMLYTAVFTVIIYRGYVLINRYLKKKAQNK